jgi:hypothetical protein
MSRISGFSGFCLNQDVQDFRIFRILSESGCPGFKDFQDLCLDFDDFV